MRRPLLLLAATAASIPLCTGAAFAATPVRVSLRTPALTIAAITASLKAGNGAGMLALLCAQDRRVLLLTQDASDIADSTYAMSREFVTTVSVTSKLGVSPMSINLHFTDKRRRLDGPIVAPYTLLLQSGTWCLSGDAKGAADTADSMRDVDSWRMQDAQERFIAAHPGSSGVALTVDATRKAATVYLGGTDLPFQVSKGTRMTVITRPATDSTAASFCISTVNIGSNDPTLATTYDSRQGLLQQGGPC